MEKFTRIILTRYSIAVFAGLFLIAGGLWPIQAMASEITPVTNSRPAPSQITPTTSPAYTLSVTIIEDAQEIVDNVVSYTEWLSSTTVQATNTFTIATAPITYAAALPRPIADVGYTIEQMQTDTDSGKTYSINTWASLFGYLIAIPIQLVKMLYQLATLMGPIGLFVSWLFFMLPFVLGVRLFMFIKNMLIGLFNFITRLFDTIFGLIKIFV